MVRTLLGSSLVLLVLSEHRPNLSESGQPRSEEISGRKGRGLSHRISVLAAVEGALEAEGAAGGAAKERSREPFVDDGMFDPRRDYWGDRSKTVGTHSPGTTPTSLNWANGEVLRTLDMIEQQLSYVEYMRYSLFFSCWAVAQHLLYTVHMSHTSAPYDN